MSTHNTCNHIAIIMDGNGRWAKKCGMPRTYGHKKGAENVVNITRAMKDSGVKYLTLYAFSTENWQRSEDEVQALMQLLNDYLDNEFQEIMKNDVKIVFIGERYMLSLPLQQKIKSVEDKSKNNKSLTLCIALSYGSRQEILSAVKKISKLVKNETQADLIYPYRTDPLPGIRFLRRPKSGYQNLDFRRPRLYP